MFRVRSFVAAAAVVLSTMTLHAAPASAQSLSVWGGWNEQGNGWQGTSPERRGSQNGYGSSGSNFGFGFGEQQAFPAIMDGGGRPEIIPQAPPVVAFANREVPGTILIDTEGRRLLYTLDETTAYDYPISVGRDGFTWTGTEKVSRIASWPDWHPPAEMRARDPKLPELMYGGVRNPLGAVALFLGNSLYRIHGTNDPKTIGFAASSGCFRMLNSHALHLASLAKVGTTVKVLHSLPADGQLAEVVPETTAQTASAPRAGYQARAALGASYRDGD